MKKTLVTIALAGLGLFGAQAQKQKSAGVAIVYISSHLNLSKVSLNVDSIKTYGFCIDSIKTDANIKGPYMDLIQDKDVQLPPVRTYIVTKNKKNEQVVIPLNFSNGYNHSKDEKTYIKEGVKPYVKDPFNLTNPVEYGSAEMFSEILQTKQK